MLGITGVKTWFPVFSMFVKPHIFLDEVSDNSLHSEFGDRGEKEGKPDLK